MEWTTITDSQREQERREWKGGKPRLLKTLEVERGQICDSHCNSGHAHMHIHTKQIQLTCMCCTEDRNAPACTCIQKLLTDHAQMFTKQHVGIYGGWWKKATLPSLLVFLRFAHSSILSLIYLLIPHCSFYMSVLWCSQSFSLSMGNWCLDGDYGKVPFFFTFACCFWFCTVHCLFLLFGCLCMECLWVCLLCVYVSVYMCVEFWSHYCLRALLPQLLAAAASVFTSPPHPRICCVFAFAGSCSQPPFYADFFLFYPWGRT